MAELDFTAIRTALEERVAKNSLRRVARQVGMSPSGLHKFIKGAAPYEKTRLKMVAWAARMQADDERSADEVLIDELIASLPEAGQAETRAELLRVLDRARKRWLIKR